MEHKHIGFKGGHNLFDIKSGCSSGILLIKSLCKDTDCCDDTSNCYSVTFYGNDGSHEKVKISNGLIIESYAGFSGYKPNGRDTFISPVSHIPDHIENLRTLIPRLHKETHNNPNLEKIASFPEFYDLHNFVLSKLESEDARI